MLIMGQTGCEIEDASNSLTLDGDSRKTWLAGWNDGNFLTADAVTSHPSDFKQNACVHVCQHLPYQLCVLLPPWLAVPGRGEERQEQTASYYFSLKTNICAHACTYSVLTHIHSSKSTPSSTAMIPPMHQSITCVLPCPHAMDDGTDDKGSSRPASLYKDVPTNGHCNLAGWRRVFSEIGSTQKPRKPRRNPPRRFKSARPRRPRYHALITWRPRLQTPRLNGR